MLKLSNICNNTYADAYFVIQVRNKSKTHWAKLRKKNSPKYKALNHFDEFYGSVFGAKWEPMREALLKRSKYVAVVNNYGNTEETIENLTKRGAHCLKNLISIQEAFTKQYAPTPMPDPDITNTPNNVAEYVKRLQSDEISKLYPGNDNILEKIDFSATDREKEAKKIKEEIVTKHHTLEQSIQEAVIDESRIIDPSMGVTSDLLHQFLPASKLKGMEEWIPESLQYSRSKDQDFPLVMEPESELVYPEHLKVYTYEMGSDLTMFPEPKRCDTGVFNYYPMDLGSVLCVLALGLRGGERVLDACAAPGGKALAALQTLLPAALVANDVSVARAARLQRVFRDYLCDFESSDKWRERVELRRLDARVITDDEGFDKVLVDVPCTTDRHSVTEDDNNIFRPDRIRERLKLPELQAQLLVNALRVTKRGGAVVYSTCSLSPAQNDGVVHAALAHAFTNYNVLASVRELSGCLRGVEGAARLARGAGAPRYGQLVVPHAPANYGPTYIAKLVRLQ